MYPDISTINATDDLSNIIIYANDLTGGVLSPLILLSFFIIIFLGSFFAQFRFSGRGRPEISFAVAGFATFGMAVLMSMKNGLLDWIYLLITLAVAVLGAAWLYFSSND